MLRYTYIACRPARGADWRTSALRCVAKCRSGITDMCVVTTINTSFKDRSKVALSWRDKPSLGCPLFEFYNSIDGDRTAVAATDKAKHSGASFGSPHAVGLHCARGVWIVGEGLLGLFNDAFSVLRLCSVRDR